MEQPAVAWRSANQKSTADSSAAAEMHALAKVLKAIKPLRELFHHMGHQQVKPNVIYEDNQAVIMSLKARFVVTKYRHIDVYVAGLILKTAVRDTRTKMRYTAR